MNSPENNPYSPPAAELDTAITRDNPVHKLPRFSTWGVLVLTILTLGLYYTYWLFTRTQIINRVYSHKISMSLVYSVFSLLLINIVLSFMSGADQSNSDLAMAANVSNLVYSLSSLFWVFTIRNRIQQMSNASRLNSYWMGGIMTFLFQVLYMQYKINEYIDSHSSSSRLAG